ncbi:MAG: TadE/TadG family type IV pilus assembly protein [Alphaproteobacteria bacterium]
MSRKIFNPLSLRRFMRATAGTSALEFAFAAPVALISIAGIIELSMMMFVTTLVEGGLREAARFGATGFTPASVSREEKILQTLDENAIGLVDFATATVTYLIYPGFEDVGKPEPYVDDSPANGAYDAGESYQDVNGNGQWDSDMGAAGLGGPGDVVLYTVNYEWKALTPLVAPFIGTNGTLDLSASVAVRNEPWATGGGGGS